jgi:hypothetical protein
VTDQGVTTSKFDLCLPGSCVLGVHLFVRGFLFKETKSQNRCLPWHDDRRRIQARYS